MSDREQLVSIRQLDALWWIAETLGTGLAWREYWAKRAEVEAALGLEVVSIWTAG